MVVEKRNILITMLVRCDIKHWLNERESFIERSFKILNCVSKRLDSEQEAKDYIDDANCNFLSKHVEGGESFFKEMGVRAFGPQQAQALAPPFLWKNFSSLYMFWKKITIRVINVIFRFLSWIQTFWKAIQNLEVSLHELISFIQSMFDIASSKHRNQYVSLFNFHFISKMLCTRENVGRYNITEVYNVQLDYVTIMSLNFQNIYENYEFVAL